VAEVPDCIFCKIAAGEIPAKIEHADEDIVAFHDINAAAPVHLLVIPRRHIASLAETTDAEAPLLGRIVSVARQLAAKFELDSGYRVVINCREDGGQSVPHIHLHLLGGRRLGWPPG